MVSFVLLLEKLYGAVTMLGIWNLCNLNLCSQAMVNDT